jgi:hypothetical protein
MALLFGCVIPFLSFKTVAFDIRIKQICANSHGFLSTANCQRRGLCDEINPMDKALVEHELIMQYVSRDTGISNIT